ncbi:MAG: MBL fold metallo-hydrolase [Roseburia sp.]
MKINEYVHLIKKEFQVTEDVKRYVNLYLITGENCYLIDSGVSGSENMISGYMKSIGRKMTDIKGVFLTHAHPDHIGAAAQLKKQTGCQIYAPLRGLPWIEDIQRQFKERPIPNFFTLVSEAVQVDCPLSDGDVIEPERGITIRALATPGHSDDSMSYILNDKMIFTGDVIPAPNDLPIFVNFEDSMRSIGTIKSIDGIENYCPAWDKVYTRKELCEVSGQSVERLCRLRQTVLEVEEEMAECSEAERIQEICVRLNMRRLSKNPLFVRSIRACKER